MDKNFVRKKAQDIAMNAGRSVLHSLAPDDFEYYACVFQLVDSENNIEKVFNFPVMPNAIQISHKPHANVKRTARGYVDQFNDSFVGATISLNGTFGRKFRILFSNDNSINEAKKEVKQRRADLIFNKDTFDLNVKTGYGMTKLLQKIIRRSTQLDEFGKPMRLYFFNFSTNESYLVEPMNFQKSQSLENNIMWNYSMELKCIADASNIELISELNKKKNIKNLLSFSSVQQSLNGTFNNLTAGGTTRQIRNIF